MKLIRKLKYILTIVFIIIIIILSIHIKKKLNLTKYENINNYEEIVIDEINSEKLDNKILEETCTIDIKGAVQKPGVYQILCNSTISDAINLSGGITEEADTSVINLAKKVTDEMVIIIYTHNEVANSNIVDTVVKVIDKECNCPNIQNDGCINTEINETIGKNNLININTATIEDFEALPGVGESKAKMIIEYREKNGNFNSIEDLLNISGIGEKIYEQIKIYITT